MNSSAGAKGLSDSRRPKALVIDADRLSRHGMRIEIIQIESDAAILYGPALT
jgi:hypothetical protein